MRKFVFFSLLILMLAIPLSAGAQGEVVIEDLQVELWPEFDQSAMLVIYRIELAAETPLPAALRFSLPLASGGPIAVAFFDGERLLTAEYEMEQVGDLLLVDFECPTTNCQFEYYDPGLTLNGTTRTFDYTWPGDMPVNNLRLRVQQPFDVIGMVFEPQMETGEFAGDGLMYYSNDFGSFAANQPMDFSLQYEKPSNMLTLDFLRSQQPQQEVPPTEESGGGLSGLTMDWRLLLVLLALVVIGVGIYGLRRGEQRKKPRKGSRRKPAYKQEKPGRGAGSGVFCHNCGTEAGKGDKFCRECGTKLRL